MIGIKEIASYIPKKRISNFDKKDLFEINDQFIREKLGVNCVAVKEDDEDTSDLCVKSFENLIKRVNIKKNEIEVLILVTQNPDILIPHTSAIIHGKLDMPMSCSCFDISHGCSGYVYGLSIIQSFMNDNGFKKGLLFTADPYSKIISRSDKETSLLFGDAATVTLIEDNPVYLTKKVIFRTSGKKYKGLSCVNGKLRMNAREIFNFAAIYVPKDIKLLLERTLLRIDDIDKFVFHQGSKYIVETISKRLMLNNDKVIYDIYNYGNTVSSSIPIILEQEIKNRENIYIVISGFGVGLSTASGLLTRIGE